MAGTASGAPATAGTSRDVTRTAGATPAATTVSVVLPCLNEANSVAQCVVEAREALASSGFEGEVVVVDNGSTDGSDVLAEDAGARVVHETRPGYGSALRKGFAAARGDIIVMADADLTYPLDRLAELVDPVVAGDADIVLGRRLSESNRATMPLLHRWLGTPVITFLTARACGRKVVTDSQSGYRAFRRSDLDALRLRGTGMELATEMLVRAARAGLRITERDTGYRERVGDSKLDTWSDGWRHLKLLLMLAPDLLLVGPSLLLAVLGVAMLVMTFVSPEGVTVGSLRWQPVFFSGIALILGVQGLLAGAFLAERSSVTSARVHRWFAFVNHASFRRRSVLAGAVMVLAGLAINAVMFAGWVRGGTASPSRGSGLASLSQSLIVVGATLAYGAVVAYFISLGSSHDTDDAPGEGLARTATTPVADTNPAS